MARRKAIPSHAFTLVELLIVIGIISVLMSLLLPAISRSRDSATRVQCASNMRQWGQAYHQYANENQGFFPYDGPPIPNACPIGGRDMSWTSSIVQQFCKDYMVSNSNLSARDRDNVQFCPSQTWHREPQNDADLRGGLIGYFVMPHRSTTDPSVSMDYTPAGNGWVEKKKFASKDRFAPIMADMQQYSTGDQNWGRFSSHLKGDKPAGGNFLFEDGRVEWYDFSDIQLGSQEPGWECWYKIRLPQ